VITLLLIGILSASVHAGETWDGNGGDNNWTTNNNWTPNGEPANDGTANIVMAGTNRLTPNVNVDWDIRSLVFSNTSGAFSISGSSGVSLGIGEGGIVNQDSQTQVLQLPVDLNANQTWSASLGPLGFGNTVAGHPLLPRTLTVTGPFNTQIGGAVTGNTSLIKNGTGTLTVNGGNINTYSGNTTVNAGMLVLDHSGGPNRAIPDNLIIGDGLGGALSDVVRLDSSNQISEAAGNTVTVNSSGLLNLNVFNETILNLSIAGGSVTANSGTLNVNGQLDMSGGTISGGTLTVNGPISTGASTSSVISSTLSNTALTFNGSGTVMLAGSSSNTTGPVTVNGGTVLLNKPAGVRALGGLFSNEGPVTIGDGVGLDIVRLMANQQIGSAQAEFQAVTINSSGLLDLNGFDQTLKVDLVGGTITTGTGLLTTFGDLDVHASSQTATVSGIVLLAGGPGTRVVVDDGPPSDDFLLDGILDGFQKYGNGTMRIVGSTSYVFPPGSPVEVSEGTLVLARTLPDTGISGDVSIRPGASLVLGANEQIRSHTLNDVVLNGTFDLAGFSETINDLTVAPVNGGANAMLITNGGTLEMRNLGIRYGTVNPTNGLVAINGTITSLGGETTALIGGNVNITSANRLFDVQDGSGAIDLEVTLTMAGANNLTKIGAGTMLLSGAANTYTGTTTVSAGTLVLGRTAIDGAIPGDLVSSGGTVRLAADEQIASTSMITLNTGGLLDLNGFTETIGNLTLDGGTIIMGSGTLVVTGSITQSVSAASNINGRLDLGDGIRIITSNDVAVAPIDLDISTQVINGGILKQGAGTLRLAGNSSFASGVIHEAGRLLIGHDNALGAGTLSLDGGTLEADSGPRTVANPIVVGTLSTVGGSADLTFAGSFTTNLGGGLAKNGGGALTISGPQNHAQGVTLFANSGTVNLNSSATGATLNVNLSNASTVVNFNADQNLNTVVLNGGRARVGDTALLGASSLSIDSDAVLELEIGGLIPGSEFAQLLVSGNATVAGTMEVTLTNGFSPTVGQSFTILTADDVDGVFTTEPVSPLPNLAFDLVYNAQSVVLTVLSALPGDYNGNGVVDAADYVVWRKNDGTSTGYNTWRAHFGQTAGNGAAFKSVAASSAVPEPPALAPIVLACLVSRLMSPRSKLPSYEN
jgi:autotransporter-associated beta strand protein